MLHFFQRMFQTIIHTIKGNIGPGMLALPKAVSLAGLWVGSIGIAILSVFCIQCMHLIVQSSQKLCSVTGRSSMSYADVAEFTFSTSSNKSIHRYAKIFRYFIYKYLEHVFKYKNVRFKINYITSTYFTEARSMYSCALHNWVSVACISFSFHKMYSR